MVVGAEERENGWIGEALAEHAAVSKSFSARGLSQVSTDMMSVGTRYGVNIEMSFYQALTCPREKMYLQGGIFSITSRILVVDLLSSTTRVRYGENWY